MARKRSFIRVFIYMLLSVVLPIALMIINHVWWIDNILLSIALIVWMGFGILVLQPYTVEGYETVEP